MTCLYCDRPRAPHRTGNKAPVTCGQPACRDEHRRVIRRRADAKYRAGPAGSRPALRSAADIDAALDAARAARVAARQAGDPYWSVDGWAQRGGRCCMDGEMRLSEVEGA